MRIQSLPGTGPATRLGTVLLAVLALMLGFTATSVTSGAATGATSDPVHAWVKRTMPTSEVGLLHPTGIAYAPAQGALVVTGEGGAGTVVSSATLAGRRLSSVTLPDALAPGAVTVDPARGRLLALAGGTLVEVDTSGVVAGTVKETRTTTRGAVSADASALALDAVNHRLFALGGGRTVQVADVAPDGSVTPAGELSLARVPSGDVAAMAYNDADHLLYLAVPSRHALYAVDGSGSVRHTYDLSGVAVASLRSMTFAPTADNTDDPAATSLYALDTGSETRLGSIAEVSLTPQAVTPAVASASLVKTTLTSSFNPPSPDPDGITLLPSGELLMADGEVDEIPSLWQSVNLWTLTLGGSVTGTGLTDSTSAATHPWTREPTGISYDSRTGHLFVSDDDQQKIFELAKGPDGKFGTMDDTFESFSMSTLLAKIGITGTPDPEDVTIDTQNGNLYVIDGVGAEVYEVSPGPDGKFGGTGATDNNVSHFDVAALGATDPEAICYYAGTNTLFVADHGSHKVYELTTTGQLVSAVSISSAGGTMEAGITVAPASSGSGISFYIVDRGVDNNDVSWPPGENDGKLYELLTDLSGGGGVSTLNAGSDQSQALDQVATLAATATKPDGSLYLQSELQVTWSTITPAPGTVTFGTPALLTTTATFSAPGSYTLRVTAKVIGTATTLIDDVVVQVVSPAQNLVTNPGFETGTTGWSAGGVTGVTLTQVQPGHSGASAVKVANTTTKATTCVLTDHTNAVSTTTTAAASYTGSIWVRGDTAGTTLQLLLREYQTGVTGPVGSVTANVTLSTGWQVITTAYTPTKPGLSTVDLTAQVAGAAPGTCFYADDAAITVGAPGAAVTATPASIDFDQTIGVPGANTVTVKNTGTVRTAVTVAAPSGEQSSDFAVTGQTCATTSGPVILAPGQTCQLTLAFTPTLLGPRAATLTVISTAPPATVALTGTGRAVLAATPSPLAFGLQNGPVSQPVTVTNTSTVPATITAVAVSGVQAADFAASQTCLGPLGAGMSCTVLVTFTPKALGARAATLTITDGGIPPATATVALSGTGVPTTLAFGDQAIGQPGTQSLQVTNSGTTTLHVTGVTLSGVDASMFKAAPTSLTVAPGQSSAITVTFTPSAPGVRSAVAAVASDSFGGTVSIALTGTGVVPVLSSSTGALSFGSQTGPSTLPLTVTDAATVPLTVTAATVSGPQASDFSASQNCVGTLLNAGQSCTVNVTFNPTALGPRTATLTIKGDGSTVPVTVALTGTGTSAIGVPTSVAFGDQAIDHPATQPLQVANSGSTTLHVTGVTISGADAPMFKAAPTSLTVAPGQSSVITVTFTPSAAGPRSATATIASDALGGPVSVALTGNGVVTVLSTSTAALSFGGHTGPATLALTVTNASAVPVRMTAATVSGAEASDFSASQNCVGTQLNPGQGCTVTVTFSPTALGARTATLTIKGDDGTVPVTVALSGTGETQLSVLPTGIDFGQHYLGTTSVAVSVTVRNVASVAVGPLTASLAGAQAAWFDVGGQCATVAPQATCTFSVTFTPAAVGPAAATLSISGGALAQAVVTLAGSGAPPLTVTTATLPSATQNAPYVAVLAASNGVPPYHWSLATPVTGLALSDTGVLSGYPVLPGTVTLTVAVHDSGTGTVARATRTLMLSVASPAYTVQLPLRDFNRDGRADIAVFRPSDRTWHFRGMPTVQYGMAGDLPVPGDYNGDGRTDIAVYRPATGTWFVRGIAVVQYGAPGDIPVPGDYNGDGRTDLAVYRPADGTWHVRGIAVVQYGAPGDVPVPGDYNGDRRTDVAVYRPATGYWYVRNVNRLGWGIPGDVPVPGDYNGDGRTDVAVYRPGTGVWYVRNISRLAYGMPGDVPVPGDYNGDHRADVTVYRPADRTWHIRNLPVIQYGMPGDIPV